MGRTQQHAAIRKVLQHHGLTKHGDGVVEADIIAALESAQAPAEGEREAFEEFVSEGGKFPGCARRCVDGEYQNPFSQTSRRAWCAALSWQARTASNVQPKGMGNWIDADDVDRLVRELDVALNGDMAAPQAKLCDIVAEVQRTRRQPLTPEWAYELIGRHASNRLVSDLTQVNESRDGREVCPDVVEFMDAIMRTAGVQAPAPAHAKSASVPDGWRIAITGGDEVVVRAPIDGPGGMTLPAGDGGILSVRLLRALCRAMLAADAPPAVAPKQTEPAQVLQKPYIPHEGLPGHQDWIADTSCVPVQHKEDQQ